MMHGQKNINYSLLVFDPPEILFGVVSD